MPGTLPFAADEHDAWAQASLSTVHLHRRRLDAGARAARRAIDLNANLAIAEFTYGAAMAWSGQYDATMEHTDKAERLSPRDPAHAWFMLNRVVVGRYEEQIEWAEKMTEAAPDHPAGWRMLAAGNGLLRVAPHMTIELSRTSTTGIRDKDLERLLDGLRKAGLPE